MLFPTFDFLLFAIPVLAGFWALANRPVARVAFLIVASTFFYMAGPKTEPPPAPWYFVGLLYFSSLLDFFCGKAIYAIDREAKDESEEAEQTRKRRRNFLLTLSLVGNLGLLGYFKYANFFIEAFTDVLGVVGVHAQPFHLDVILPLGISFYTFQSLSYTLDIWRGKLTPETSFRRFLVFVMFFPQLVAGPIVRASEFLPQLHAGPRFSREDMEVGAYRIAKGLAKKVVLGDYIAVHLTDRVFDAPETFTSVELLIALYAYTLQIYADFSGYSDIAIGLARMLGFKIPENFDRPYQSRDIAEYWRRWHMTLSGWLRDYLFFSLLARLGARGGYFALWLTMFLVGMWHGASWNFVIYANIHAGAVVFNRWNRQRDRDDESGARLVLWPLRVLAVGGGSAAILHWVTEVPWMHAGITGAGLAALFSFICWLPNTGTKANRAVHIVLTFHLLVLSRIFFRAPDFETATSYVSGVVSFDGLGIRPGLATPAIWALLVGGLAYHFTPKEWVNVNLRDAFRRVPGWLLGIFFALGAYGLMKLMAGSPRAFIYFQF